MKYNVFIIRYLYKIHPRLFIEIGSVPTYSAGELFRRLIFNRVHCAVIFGPFE